MTDPRAAIFAEIKKARGGIPFDALEVGCVDNTLDALNVPREIAAAHMIKDGSAFFAGIRKVTGGLNQIQVDCINLILTAAARHPIGWAAYELATAWHEARFEPVEEIGKGRGKSYGRPGARMKPIPDAPTYGGQIPFGRGLVQITWCDNYEWLDKAASAAGLIKPGELLANFDLAMRPDIAAFALVAGMETGAFTGKKLADYISSYGKPEEWISARRIVNGTDRAQLIAGYAERFRPSLQAGGW